MKKFKIPKTDWKSIPVDSAKFILEEGKNYHEYTLNESEKITNRAYALVLLLSVILSAIVGYTFTKLTGADFTVILSMNLYFSFVISFFIIVLATLIFPRSLMQKGRIPSKLAQESLLLNKKLNKDEIYLAYIIREIENTQDKIDFNLAINKKRRLRLEVILYIISALLPLYLLIAFCVIN
jgi:hypothetical protein